MEELGNGTISVVFAATALEREQDLEIGRRSGGEIVSGEEEPSLDLALGRLIGECGG